MAIVIPQSDLYLLKVPIEIDNRNQLTFTNATAQYNYFNSLQKHTNPEQGTFTYQRQDGTVRYPACIDDIREYNYCMYRNDGYSNKWFYAFITNMQYISDKVTAITLKTDVWQTWMFNLNFKTSFVEREHVNNDTVGIHTIPENLETGEYIENAHDEVSAQISDLYYLTNNYVCFGITKVPNITIPAQNKQYNGIFSGVFYMVSKTLKDAENFIHILQESFSDDVICSLFMIPKVLVTLGESDWFNVIKDTWTANMAYVPYTTGVTSMGNIYINRQSTLDGYTPRNKKLLCYPYNYLVISNNAGSNQEFYYENFTGSFNTTCQFNIEGVVTPGCGIKMYPVGYKSGSLNYSMDGAKLPECSWLNDSYTNWLTQNAVNFPLETVKDVALIGAGAIVTGATAGIGSFAGVSMIGAGASGIFEMMKSKYEHSLMPSTAKGGVNNGDYIFSKKRTYEYYKMSIKNEYAKIIDNYFDIFGYKVNDLKVPNVTGRANWNYVKTIGCNIEGYIPQYDIQEIKNMFNTGITFWHNPNTFLDYSQSNAIL